MSVDYVYSRVSERDVDVLILHLFSIDSKFVQLFADKVGIVIEGTTLSSVELSKADAKLGESDVTAIFNAPTGRIALLIEDKIDAIAMPEQPERYIKRGEKGKKNGDYDEFYSFIVCPQKYYDSNEAAKRYPYFVSYEEIKAHLESLCEPLFESFIQQIVQAIEKAKTPPQVIINELANNFFRKYKEYQENNYPVLDLRTKSTSNGYWAHYETRLGNVYILHKLGDGKVDITFRNASTHMNEMEQIASWLRSHGYPDVKAVVTGKAGSLNIKVPKLDMQKEFDESDETDIVKCFDVLKDATELTNMIALTSDMADLK